MEIGTDGDDWSKLLETFFVRDALVQDARKHSAMLNAKIRPATRTDSTEFLKLVSAFARFVHMAPPDASARRRILKDLFSRKRVHVLLAHLGKKLVGYVFYYYTYASFQGRPTLYLEDLFVLDDYRSKGIGHSLFLACAKDAIQEGCGRLEWSVLKWNESAIDYYDKLGAKRLDELYYYRLTAKQLKRLLPRRNIQHN